MRDKKIKKVKNNLPIYSMSLFIFVLITTISLFFGNFYLKNNIKEINAKIKSYEDDIISLKKDKNIQVYSLIDDNKSILAKMDKISKVTDYIKYLSKISTTTGIDFRGFNMYRGKIKTSAVSKNKLEKTLAYKKIKNFIKSYRDGKESIFDLDFINSFNGMDMIKFDVVFVIK